MFDNLFQRETDRPYSVRFINGKSYPIIEDTQNVLTKAIENLMVKKQNFTIDYVIAIYEDLRRVKQELEIFVVTIIVLMFLCFLIYSLY